MHEQRQLDPATQKHFLEQIVFEMNYDSGQWRKLRRKRILRDDEL